MNDTNNKLAACLDKLNCTYNISDNLLVLIDESKVSEPEVAIDDTDKETNEKELLNVTLIEGASTSETNLNTKECHLFI